MIEIYLIRHGECRGNREDLFRGRHDFPLNENGIKQAECLRDRLKKHNFQTIYTSPLKRSKQTAEILSDNNIRIIEENDFTNISLGEWENTPKKIVRDKYPDSWQLWQTEPERLIFPGMETLAQVQDRSFKTLKKIIQNYSEGKIAVVTHRAVLKPLIAAILSIQQPYFWKIHVDTAAYSIVEYQPPRGFTLTLLNEHDHLQDFVREDSA
jgi:broad specificity phosphatase PhoE